MMKDYRDMPTVGYWSEMGLVEVKEIEYGVEDHVKVVAGTMTSTPTSHYLKVYYNSQEPYIKLHGRRLKFSDCIFVFQTVYHK